MHIGRPRWKQLILSIVWCTAICLFATSRDKYDNALASDYFAAALVTSVIIYLRLRPSFLDAAWMLGLTAALAAFDYRVLGFEFSRIGVLSLLGCAGLLVFGVRCVWADAADRKLLLPGLLASALFCGSDFFAGPLLNLTTALHPRTLDLYLLYFDGSLGFQPSFLAGELFFRAPWLHSFCMFIYVTLPFSMAVAYGNQLLRNKSFGFPMMASFVITGPIGVLFYNLFPASGPRHVFLSQFPLHPPIAKDFAQILLAPVPVEAYAPRNAIPSLHMAWVILAWWWSRGLSWGPRTIVLVYVIFTAIATIGVGEHYFIDLLVALPFAVMLQAAVTFSARKGVWNKVGPVLLGLAGVLVWFAILGWSPRLAWSSPAVPWLMIGLTLLVYLTAEQRYCRLPEDKPEVSALSATAD
ncbi:MAG: phosphatase PAP2 family protein [Terriglobales bacterium]|jgi:hypothetical protein